MTVAELAFLSEAHLLDMGVTRIGDRVKILNACKQFTRKERTKARQRVVLKAKMFTWTPCGAWFAPTFAVTHSSLTIRTWTWWKCLVEVDNVDLMQCRDLKLVRGCCFSTVVVQTNDAGSDDGRYEILLTHHEATKFHQTLKNLWEEHQLLSGVVRINDVDGELDGRMHTMEVS